MFRDAARSWSNAFSAVKVPAFSWPNTIRAHTNHTTVERVHRPVHHLVRCVWLGRCSRQCIAQFVRTLRPKCRANFMAELNGRWCSQRPVICRNDQTGAAKPSGETERPNCKQTLWLNCKAAKAGSGRRRESAALSVDCCGAAHVNANRAIVRQRAIISGTALHPDASWTFS